MVIPDQFPRPPSATSNERRVHRRWPSPAQFRELREWFRYKNKCQSSLTEDTLMGYNECLGSNYFSLRAFQQQCAIKGSNDLDFMSVIMGLFPDCPEYEIYRQVTTTLSPGQVTDLANSWRASCPDFELDVSRIPDSGYFCIDIYLLDVNDVRQAASGHPLRVTFRSLLEILFPNISPYLIRLYATTVLSQADVSSIIMVFDFLDTSGDHLLDLEEFDLKASNKEVYMAGNKFDSALFHALDLNGSNSLSLMEMLRALFPLIPIWHISAVVRECRGFSDSQSMKAELRKRLKGGTKARNKTSARDPATSIARALWDILSLFLELDVDRSGTLSQDEVLGHPVLRKLGLEMDHNVWSQLDEDKNGVLTVRELALHWFPDADPNVLDRMFTNSVLPPDVLTLAYRFRNIAPEGRIQYDELGAQWRSQFGLDLRFELDKYFNEDYVCFSDFLRVYYPFLLESTLQRYTTYELSHIEWSIIVDSWRLLTEEIVPPTPGDASVAHTRKVLKKEAISFNDFKTNTSVASLFRIPMPDPSLKPATSKTAVPLSKKEKAQRARERKKKGKGKGKAHEDAFTIMFNIIDKDNSGEIEFHELMEYMYPLVPTEKWHQYAQRWGNPLESVDEIKIRLFIQDEDYMRTNLEFCEHKSRADLLRAHEEDRESFEERTKRLALEARNDITQQILYEEYSARDNILQQENQRRTAIFNKLVKYMDFLHDFFLMQEGNMEFEETETEGRETLENIETSVWEFLMFACLQNWRRVNIEYQEQQSWSQIIEKVNPIKAMKDQSSIDLERTLSNEVKAMIEAQAVETKEARRQWQDSHHVLISEKFNQMQLCATKRGWETVPSTFDPFTHSWPTQTLSRGNTALIPATPPTPATPATPTWDAKTPPRALPRPASSPLFKKKSTLGILSPDAQFRPKDGASGSLQSRSPDFRPASAPMPTQTSFFSTIESVATTSPSKACLEGQLEGIIALGRKQKTNPRAAAVKPARQAAPSIKMTSKFVVNY